MRALWESGDLVRAFLAVTLGESRGRCRPAAAGRMQFRARGVVPDRLLDRPHRHVQSRALHEEEHEPG